MKPSAIVAALGTAPIVTIAPTVRFRFLPLLLTALAVVALTVACGSDEDEPPPATEAPTEAATPESTAPPPPSSTQPATGLDGLAITAATTGQDVLDHVSEAEAACLGEALDAAGYEAFLGAELVTAYRDATALGPLFGCLTGDNFVAFGMNYTVARAGLASAAQSCLLALGREHPDAVVTILGIEEAPEAVAALARETHNYVFELYDCLNTEERVKLVLHMWSELGTYAVPAEEMMAAFTEEEITCFTEAFGITREQLETVLATRQPGQSSPEATPCITTETYGRIITAMLGVQVGGLTEESGACVHNFAVEHPHFLEVARVGTFDPSAMSASEFEEIAADGLRLFECLTEDELKEIQAATARALASFDGTE